nr:MAG TPA: hypothetical protein [Caudoviricetes sp.]DAU61726.1 MAG TPA: hypothetical protein [Bacteriophage sp.]
MPRIYIKFIFHNLKFKSTYHCRCKFFHIRII